MRALKVYGSVFLASALPVAVLLGLGLGGLFEGFAIGGGFGEALGTGAVGGLVFGILMSAVLGTMQLLGSRGTPRGGSLSPRQERSVPVRGGPDLPDRIVGALRSLPAEVTGADPRSGRFTARRGTSWKSWGEDVVVQLSGDPDRPSATVSSRPRVPTTLIDYGRGRRNVEHVVGRLTSQSPPGERALSGREPVRSRPAPDARLRAPA